jgi:hypothetical protein
MDNGINESILGHSIDRGSNINRWWDRYMEPDYINAWLDYGNKYEAIVNDFLFDLRKDKKPVNYIEFSKGIASSTQQEIYVYLEVLKSLGNNDQKNKAKEIESLVYKKLSKLEEILSQIKPSLEQKRKSYNEFQLESRISNVDISQLSDQLKQEVLPATTSESNELIKASTEKLIAAFDRLVSYIQIVNAVSYKEKYDSGYYKSDKCLELQKSGKTLAALAECKTNEEAARKLKEGK